MARTEKLKMEINLPHLYDLVGDFLVSPSSAIKMSIIFYLEERLL